MEHFYQDIQGWSRPEDQGVLLNYLLQNLNFKDCIKIAEIGVFMGRCTALWNVELINKGIDYEYYAIDHFLGSSEHDKGVDYLNICKKNLNPIHDRIKIIQNNSLSESNNYEDNFFDIVYIDASHEYEHVKNDILSWIPKVKTGGIICGDDYHQEWKGVVKAVDEIFGNGVKIIGNTQWAVHKEIPNLKNDVTFFTNCSENDWKTIIMEGGFQRKVENLNYDFFKKILIITNVLDRNLVEEEVTKLKNQNIIDDYYFTDDYSTDVLEFFGINKEDFNGGYWYSMGPLTSIFKCESEYMLYSTSDVVVERKDYDWINSGIEHMKKNDDIKVVNPVWNMNYAEAQYEENFYIELNFSKPQNDKNWFYMINFSDQCFLVKTENFKKKIYNEKDDLSELFYPDYAGDSFEKRVSSYLKNNKYYRITSKNITYYHPLR